MAESTNTTPEATDLAVVGCINEEAGEIMEVLGRIVKVAGKIARHGMVAKDTHVTGDGQTYDNRADLETECGQLIGAIRFGVRRGLLNPKRLFEEAEAKLTKLSSIHGDGDAAQAPVPDFRQEFDAPPADVGEMVANLCSLERVFRSEAEQFREDGHLSAAQMKIRRADEIKRVTLFLMQSS